MPAYGRRDYLRRTGIAATTGMLGLTAGCLGDDDQIDLVIGGGGSGTNTYQKALVYQQIMNDHSDSINITVQETGGTVASYRLYDEGDIDFFSTTDYEYMASQAQEDAYEEDTIQNPPYQGFASGGVRLFAVAREDTDIDTYDDLAGANVWPMWPDASTRYVCRNYFQAIGLWDEMNVVDVAADDIAGATAEGEIDALILNDTINQGEGDDILAGYVTETDARVDLKALEMSDDQRETIQEETGRDVPMTDLSLFEQDLGMDEVPGVLVWYVKYFGVHLEEDVVYELVTTLNEHADVFKDSDAIGPGFEDPEELAAGILPDYPVHPGFAQALQEWDAWEDDWEEGEVRDRE
ncbi:TAXI family TRAP transporter solute-binding subunit [Natronorubrum sp. FCH18a]|uniref:TAXI family TRAP transporter solute-binding subunit n=1 Tax=Natronorubrum sp. FCH18a TaxID=3447018 RepID=UPI003F50F428